jgi:hypothetical protein
MNDVGFIAAVALGFTFLASGVGKLRDHEGFVLAVLDYEVLPPPSSLPRMGTYYRW